MNMGNDRELNYVRFDVGHYLHVCHRGTIERFENSFLAKLIAPEFDNRKSESDYIVIDRDGKHFGSILNFMRDASSLDLDSWTDGDLTDLMREADFYCLADLVQLCEKSFERRDVRTQSDLIESSRFVVPPNMKLEIIYGTDILRQILVQNTKPTIVINHRNVRRYHIDSWIEELVKISDHSKIRVSCLSSKSDESICGRNASELIMGVYEPSKGRFGLTVPAPPCEEFRCRRQHYKCKIFKFWFLVQNT